MTRDGDTTGAPLARALEEALGEVPAAMRALGAGAAGQVLLLEMAGGRRLVAKTAGTIGSDAAGRLDREGWMLRELARLSDLPVPAVHHAAPGLLIMDHVAGGGAITRAAEIDAADHIAALHAVRGEAFGLARDTLIGPLDQPNGWAARWLDFYAERRLLPFGRAALEAGGIGAETMTRIERLTARLDRYLEEPPHPSLIHGDLWGGNVIVAPADGRERITGFIDPAIHYAHPEVELAFTTLFGTFGGTFFARYAEHRPIAPGFHDIRRDLYLLYPLLVHATLFGAGYGRRADAILRRAVG
ncbi:fructosamine kinase family protein [Marivibrio halodurans]|uniref:Fructosamine kinase family protein n=1 Tax=Marivibrio halodurans TaxID=2039722 RepID=A0A8J7V3H6_9PROT|nr:fructosamine kinase family protein [Marivibrio halodurans]MBP5857952.1 fructosamine kinase family protein [Marivibrio halodurans]